MSDVWDFAREHGLEDAVYRCTSRLTADLPPDLVDDLKSEYPMPPERRPGGWTVAEAAGVWGVQVAAALRRCKNMVDNHKATVEVCWIGGRKVSVYYPVEST